jgi:hypothetical protein
MPQPLLTPLAKLSNPKQLGHHRAHACLGSYALIHLIYRYYIFFQDEPGEMGFDDNTSSIALFIPHIFLQLSGFGFKIPRKRHPEGNRIWPEYRWHALVFFCRCLSLMTIAWYRKRNLPPNFDFWNAAAVFLTMISADAVTRYFQRIGESSPTIRGLNAPKGALYLMSAAQFHATVHCLLTSDRMSVQLAALTVVQTTSFGMTLRRKGKINLPQGLVLYSFVLALGMLVIWDDLVKGDIFFVATTIGNIAAMGRMDLRLNKYILWAAVTCVLQYLKDTDTIGSDGWIVPSRCTTLMLIASATYRQMAVDRQV